MNVPIKKIEIIIEKGKKEELLEELQKLGVLEVISNGESVGEIDLPRYAELKFAKSFLEEFRQKQSFFRKILSSKQLFNLSELEKLSSSQKITEIISQCANLEEKINKLNLEKEKLEREIDILYKVKGLPVSLFNGGMKNYSYKVAFAGDRRENLLNELEGINHSINFTEEGYFFIIYNKKEESRIESIFQKEQLKEEEVFWKKLPSEELKDKEKELNEVLLEREISFKEAEKMALSLPEIEALIDFYKWEAEKLEASSGEETKKYYRTEGWIANENISLVRKKIKEISEKSLVSELEIGEDDSPPVYLKNRGLIASFVPVTNVYGLPKKDELDPTPHLALFFALFFGLALSDAGYGIMLIIISILLKKIIREKDLHSFFNLFIISGVFTIVAGILTGTFFGTEVFAGYRILNPIESPIETLLFVMILGAVQIFVGIFIGMIQKFMQSDIKGALGEKGGSILFFLGVFLYFITDITLFAILGVAFLFILNILFSSSNGIVGKVISGFGGLYGIVGYFSDILSYSRLLALGLATGIIAMVINLIAFLAKDMIPIPLLNWVVMILILVFGHIGNLLINALGSFIHSARLQFVEFFSKFMEGGGRHFKPLNKKGRFIEINE